MPKTSTKGAKTKPAGSPKKRRGGRKPGAWTQVKPEQIVAHRKEHKVSRAMMAAMLGVSTTTIQNWETGKAVATAKAQARLVEAMSGSPRRPAAPTSAEAHKNGAASTDMVIDATARIVAAFLATAKIKREELRGVVEEVRAALA